VSKGLKNSLKVIIYLKETVRITGVERKLFAKEFHDCLVRINPDFRMVEAGIKFNFIFEFKNEPKNLYKNSKFNYFL
jgi:hypothetical protein